MRKRSVALVLGVLFSTGCGEASGTPDAQSGGRDAGTLEGVDAPGGSEADAFVSTTAPPPPQPPSAAPAEPMAPAASRPPDLSVCPTGWRMVPASAEPPDATTDYVTCEPYATDDPASCPAGQAHFVGTAGCQPVGDPCPADEWPAGIDALSSVIFVNDTVIVPGLGNTRLGAYRTISQALSRATSGTTVAVAKGTYDEVLTIPDGVTVLGACAAETTIRPTGGYDRTISSEGVARAAAASTGTLRNVTVDVAGVNVGGIGLSGAAAYEDRSLTLRGVAILNAYDVGLYAQGTATLTAEGVTVRDTRANSTGSGGNAVLVDGGTANVTRGVFVNSREAGIGLLGGSATLADVAVIGTQSGMDGEDGAGLLIFEGGQATVTRGLFDSNHNVGIGVADSGSMATITDTVVRRTEPTASVIDGFGLFVGPGAAAIATRSHFDRNQSAGVVAAGGDARVWLEHVAVTRTAPIADGRFGRGLDVELGALADLDRVVLDGNQDNGVFVTDPGTSLEALDVTILHTRPGQSSIDGVGAVHVRNQASATITGATIADNEEGGVHVIGSGTSATLANIVLRDNDTGPSSIGDGILVDEGGYLALDRASMTGSQQHGVFVNGADSELAATDLRIAQTRASDSGECGWALRAQDGARVRVQRASFEDSTELGVFARGGSTNVTLEDTAVVRTAAAADGTDGFGIVAFDGAELSLERGSVTESHDVGILASDSGTSVSLLDVRVSSTAASPDGTRGFGAAAQDGASLSMGRVEVSESSDVGVLVADATATLVDVRVTGVVERPCLSRGDCPGSATWRSGMGVVTVNGSQLSATSLHVESAAACGMLVSASPVGGEGASDMSLELALSGVYRNAVGLCLQVSGIDPGPGLHLDSTNGVPLDRSSFPPATAVPFL